MSTTQNQLITEDYPLSPVPFSDRRSIWSLAPLLMGFTLTSTTLFAGGQLGTAFRFWPDLIGLILVGNLVLGIYCAFLGYIAYESGLTTVLMARFSFGNVGSRWVDFILGFTQIGWYAYTTALIAEVFNQLIGLPTSWNWLTIIFFNYVFCSTAYFGYQAMAWLSRLAVPAMLILIVLSLSIAVGDVDSFATLQIEPDQPLGLGAALTVIIATFISGGTNATNWTRFANSRRTAVLGTFAAFFFVNGLMVFSGAFSAIVYGNEDLISVMAQQGLLALGLVLLLLNVWTTQDNTIYAFAVAGAHMFRINKRTAFVLGGATVALVFALGGIYNLLVPFLILLGTFIPPVGGVIIADFWLRHRGHFPSLTEPLPAFNWAGILAYVLASAIAYFLPGVKPLNGIIAAIIFYLLLSRLIPPTPQRKAVRA